MSETERIDADQRGRADHPGPPERRDRRRRRLRRVRAPAAREGAERRREREASSRKRAARRASRSSTSTTSSRTGAPGLKLNAPLFQGVKEADALVRGTWGAAPADGLEPQEGDFVVEKMRMSAWEGTKLEQPARWPRPRHGDHHRRLDEHVDRAHVAHRRRQGLLHGRPGGRLLDDERRVAQRVDQLRAAERLDGDELAVT